MAFKVNNGEVNLGDAVNTKSHGQGKFESFYEGKLNIRCGKELYTLDKEEVSVIPLSKVKVEESNKEEEKKEEPEENKKKEVEDKKKEETTNKK